MPLFEHQSPEDYITLLLFNYSKEKGKSFSVFHAETSFCKIHTCCYTCSLYDDLEIMLFFIKRRLTWKMFVMGKKQPSLYKNWALAPSGGNHIYNA